MPGNAERLTGLHADGCDGVLAAMSTEGVADLGRT
jgi:hypothetical protein